MAVLSDQNRQKLSNKFQKAESRDRTPINGLQSDCKILIDSLDDYLDTEASEMNQSIPPDQRPLFSAQQKARALIYVVEERYLQG